MAPAPLGVTTGRGHAAHRQRAPRRLRPGPRGSDDRDRAGPARPDDPRCARQRGRPAGLGAARGSRPGRRGAVRLGALDRRRRPGRTVPPPSRWRSSRRSGCSASASAPGRSTCSARPRPSRRSATTRPRRPGRRPRRRVARGRRGPRPRPPFLLSSRGYGLLVHTASGLTAELGVRSPTAATLAVEEPALDLVLFPSNWPRTALAGYARLTGRAVVPPQRAFDLAESGDAAPPGDVEAMRARAPTGPHLRPRDARLLARRPEPARLGVRQPGAAGALGTACAAQPAGRDRRLGAARSGLVRSAGPGRRPELRGLALPAAAVPAPLRPRDGPDGPADAPAAAAGVLLGPRGCGCGRSVRARAGSAGGAGLLGLR